MNDERLNAIYYDADTYVPVGSETVKDLVKEIKRLKNNLPAKVYVPSKEDPKPEPLPLQPVEPEPLEKYEPAK